MSFRRLQLLCSQLLFQTLVVAYKRTSRILITTITPPTSSHTWPTIATVDIALTTWRWRPLYFVWTDSARAYPVFAKVSHRATQLSWKNLSQPKAKQKHGPAQGKYTEKLMGKLFTSHVHRIYINVEYCLYWYRMAAVGRSCDSPKELPNARHTTPHYYEGYFVTFICHKGNTIM